MATETIPARVDSRFRGGMASTDQVDVCALRQALEREVEGEVRFDAGTKALYATDASNYRQVPLGVVVPKTLDDVVATHRICHKLDAPILHRGGGMAGRDAVGPCVLRPARNSPEREKLAGARAKLADRGVRNSPGREKLAKVVSREATLVRMGR